MEKPLGLWLAIAFGLILLSLLSLLIYLSPHDAGTTPPPQKLNGSRLISPR